MALVKIKVDKQSSGSFQKYLLQFIPQIHHTVKDFLKMVKQVLDIDWPLSQILILKSGYIIPHSLSSRIFIKCEQLKFKLIHQIDNKTIKQQNKLHGSVLSQQSSQQNISQQSSSQSQQVKQRVKKIKNSSLNQKKMIKNKKINIQYQNQQSYQMQQSQQSQQSSELPVIGNKRNQILKKKQQKMKKHSVVQKQKSSSSSENQSKLTQKIIKNKNKSNTANIINKIKGQDKKVLLNQQKDKINRKQKMKIIEMDSSSQESSEQQKQKFKINKENKVQATQPKMIAQPKNQNSIKIPPSIRQKYEKNTFKTHQQQQWINLSKQVLKKYYDNQQNKQIPFVKVNNLIRFKIIELDQQKFIPVSSQWIQGTVSFINSEGKITLSKVTQINRPFRQKYEIFQHNMLELQINKNFILKEQIQFINSDKSEKNLIQLPQQKNIENLNNDQQKRQQKCSIEKFICGQVNFYFSDKNYPTDLFMRMHANNHPQKYFPIRVMLNFPKIKKVLKDQNKLFEYLSTDEKKNQRNFQIDQINKMIRKKDLKKNDQNNEALLLNEADKIQKTKEN